MTIEEIKEWRDRRINMMTWSADWKLDEGFEIIDTLLAEVDLEKSNHENTKHWLSETRKHLTIATEALERIVSATTQRITTARYIARTALERIEE